MLFVIQDVLLLLAHAGLLVHTEEISVLVGVVEHALKIAVNFN